MAENTRDSEQNGNYSVRHMVALRVGFANTLM